MTDGGDVSTDSLNITSESDIFENVIHSFVVVKGCLHENIAFWHSIGASNWLLKVIREGYCLPLVDLPPMKFFHNHGTTLLYGVCVFQDLQVAYVRCTD